MNSVKRFLLISILLTQLCSLVPAISLGISPATKSVCVEPYEDSSVYVFISNGDLTPAVMTVESLNESIAKPVKSCDEGAYDKCSPLGQDIEVPPKSGKVILIKVMPLPPGDYKTTIMVSTGTGTGSGMGTHATTGASLTIKVDADCDRVFEKAEYNKTLQPVCGDGICDSNEDCPEDCPTSSWLPIILAVVLILVVVGVVYYKKTH